MQAALDVTALMVAKEALNIKSAQVQKMARTYFNAQFDRLDVKQLKTTFQMIINGPGDYTIAAEATGFIDTAIARVIGKDAIDLRVRGFPNSGPRGRRGY